MSENENKSAINALNVRVKTEDDFVNIKGKEHPLYKYVLDLAHNKGIESIKVELIQNPFTNDKGYCVMKAIVVGKNGETFEAHGDATPNNVASMVAPHLLRVAETRAKGRALRDFVNVGEALREELS